MGCILTGRRVLLGATLMLVAGCVSQPAQSPGTDFVIFFTAQSAALDPAATAILDSVAATAKADARAPVTVSGYADRAGTPQANQILSRLRAQVVADGLVERGVDRSRVRLRARGATGGDPGVESRRVEIDVGA